MDLSEKLRSYGSQTKGEDIVYSYQEYLELHSCARELEEKLDKILLIINNQEEKSNG